MNTTEPLAVTGATGQLGQLVMARLLAKVPADRLVAIVRNPTKAGSLASRGVIVRQADYEDLDALERAMVGVDRVLLISSSEVGKRVAHHRNVISAARTARVRLLVYTSLLHADASPLSLAAEHLATEKAIRESGVPFVILRNGWYAENYTGFAGLAVATGAFLGSAGSGRLSLAARADYAAAAAAALVGGVEAGSTVELAGDQAVTLPDLAAEISKQSAKEVVYRNLPRDAYAARLRDIGLPEAVAESLADWDVDASHDALFHSGHELSRLIGRPTTPLDELVGRALRS